MVFFRTFKHFGDLILRFSWTHGSPANKDDSGCLLTTCITMSLSEIGVNTTLPLQQLRHSISFFSIVTKFEYHSLLLKLTVSLVNRF